MTAFIPLVTMISDCLSATGWPGKGEGLNVTHDLEAPCIVWQALPASLSLSESSLTLLGQLAALPVYVVGGWSRDVLLGGQPADVDLLYHGDDFVSWLASLHESGWQVGRTTPYLTAQITHPQLPGLEVAAPRREYYLAGGKLQRVVTAGVEEDLLRRDFTLNSILVDPDTRCFADPFSVLQKPLWQAVHSLSLAEDPLRIVRLARFSAVVQYPVEPQTLVGARDTARSGHFSLVEKFRIRSELDRASRQGVCAQVLRQLKAWGLPQLSACRLPDNDEAQRSFARWIKANALDGSAELLRDFAGLP